MLARRGFLVASLMWLSCNTAWADGVGAQIFSALERYRVAVEQMNVEEQLSLFTEDAEWSQGNEEPIRGRARIRAFLLAQSMDKTVGYEVRVAATRVQIDVAIQNGYFSQRIISPRREAVLVSGVLEIQWVRQSDGSWLIGRLHTDPVRRPAGLPFQ